MVWTRKETTSRIHWKADTGDLREDEEDDGRDAWTVSFETRQLSGQQKMKSMTELALLQRLHN